MKNYEKPVVLMNEELAEGVYAASGDGDCWTLTYTVPQRWNGEGMVIELVATHSTELQHLSLGTVVTVTFDQPILSARSESTEFVTSVSGTTVTAERNLLADSQEIVIHLKALLMPEISKKQKPLILLEQQLDVRNLLTFRVAEQTVTKSFISIKHQRQPRLSELAVFFHSNLFRLVE